LNGQLRERPIKLSFPKRRPAYETTGCEGAPAVVTLTGNPLRIVALLDVEATATQWRTVVIREVGTVRLPPDSTHLKAAPGVVLNEASN
jgi:hypothetical protein